MPTRLTELTEATTIAPDDLLYAVVGGNSRRVKASNSVNRGAPVTKSADFTVADAENWLINDKASTACVVTLPDATTSTGREIMFQNLRDLAVNSASSNVIPLRGGSAGTAILPAATGSWAKLVSNGTAWQIVAQSAGINLGSAVSAASTGVDIGSIPASASRVTILLSGVSTNGTSLIQFQLGDSGGIENTGYTSYGSAQSSAGIVAASATSGFVMYDNARDATTAFSGTVTLSKFSGNTWLCSAILGDNDNATANLYLISGVKTLSDVLDRVRITTVGGANTFDAGSINVSWE